MYMDKIGYMDSWIVIQTMDTLTCRAIVWDDPLQLIRK